MLNVKTISFLLLTVNLILLIGAFNGVQSFFVADSPWIPKYAAAYSASKTALAPLKQPIIATLVGIIIVLQLYMTITKTIKFLLPLICISLYVATNIYVNDIVENYPTLFYSEILYVLYILNFGLIILHMFFTSRYTNKYAGIY